jgi:hypothetical protein
VLHAAGQTVQEFTLRTIGSFGLRASPFEYLAPFDLLGHVDGEGQDRFDAVLRIAERLQRRLIAIASQ